MSSKRAQAVMFTFCSGDKRGIAASKIHKKLGRADPTQVGELVDLSRRHVAASLTAAPSIFTAGRTVALPSKRPELRCDSARACSGIMSSFFAAADVAAAAFVRIGRLTHPGEFGTDFFD